jgi:hypothetical protein
MEWEYGNMQSAPGFSVGYGVQAGQQLILAHGTRRNKPAALTSQMFPIK